MNEYTLRITGDDVEVEWKVRAPSRYEAAERSRKAFAEALEGMAGETGERVGPLYGLKVLVGDPERIDRRHVVDGPYEEEYDRCPECGHEPVESIGEPCRIAERSMPVQDYYGDGARYVSVGVHDQGWHCPECGAGDMEPCVHD